MIAHPNYVARVVRVASVRTDTGLENLNSCDSLIYSGIYKQANFRLVVYFVSYLCRRRLACLVLRWYWVVRCFRARVKIRARVLYEQQVSQECSNFDASRRVLDF